MQPLEQLAQELGGNIWIKGDMKRIYLDRGYNTNKMTTKTYIFQRQDGTFGVNCQIDCPSQHDNWIEKEQQQIIESVEQQIKEALSEVYFLIKNIETGLYVSYSDDVFDVVDNCTKTFLSNEEAETYLNEEVSCINSNKAKTFEIVELSKAEYKQALENQVSMPVVEPAQPEIVKNKPKKAEQNTFIALGNGKKYEHPRFGIGTVVSEDEIMVEIEFSEGRKSLLKQFAKLTEIL